MMERKVRRESCTLPGHLSKPALIKVDSVMVDLFCPLAVDSRGPDIAKLPGPGYTQLDHEGVPGKNGILMVSWLLVPGL